MPVTKDENLPLQTAQDVVIARQLVRTRAAEMGFSLVDQTKIITAASELARNAIEHGGGGHCRIQCLLEGVRKGLRLVFEDTGPGIPDVQLALTDGYTSKNGMGLGLSGAKRLVNEFSIESKVGEGTRVTVIKWK